MSGVPPHVLEAFGARAETTERLAGGLGPAYRNGGVVLKPVGDEADARFIAEAMAAVVVDPARVRVARPVRAVGGDWVVDGWTASEHVAGAHIGGPHPWSAALDAVDALGDGLSALDAAPGHRTHRWAVADRVAWGEASIEVHPRIEALCSDLRTLITEVDTPSQLIHGDLASNLLFEPGLPPALIDFSPYMRPVAFALAVYVVDAIGWHGAGQDLLELVQGDPMLRACLPRAAIFRLVALDGYRREDGLDIVGRLPAYEHIRNVVVASTR